MIIPDNNINILNRVTDMAEKCADILMMVKRPALGVIHSVGNIKTDHVIDITITPEKFRFEQRCDSDQVYELYEVDLALVTIGFLTCIGNALYRQEIGEIYELARRDRMNSMIDDEDLTMEDLLKNGTEFFKNMGEAMLVGNVGEDAEALVYHFKNPNDERHTITITIDAKGTTFVQISPALGVRHEAYIPMEAASHAINMNMAASILACVNGSYAEFIIPDEDDDDEEFDTVCAVLDGEDLVEDDWTDLDDVEDYDD